jgi:putative methyltransferase (TIGR04325 family)
VGGSTNDTRPRLMLRDFVPPIVIATAKRLLHRARRKQYPTYETALMDCPEHGHENEDIVNVVLHKTKKYRDGILSGGPIHLSPTNAYSLCSILTSIGERELHVLDFGAACGAHYFLARAVLSPACRMKWIVVETPEMAQRAKTALGTCELTFTSDLREAADSLRRIDLLHTSGTLQCVNNPEEYLKTIVSFGATHTLLNRLG